jgi:NhaA family Na+:H+ antiporter
MSPRPSKHLDNDLAAAVVLLAAAVLALALANTPWARSVEAVLALKAGGTVLGLDLAKTVSHWINDGLMAIFFLVVGMEIKREVVEGELSQPSKVALPIAGALGGIIVPAAIYATFTWRDPVALQGWAIPSATDIAFAVAVFAAVGPRAPHGLRIFLLTLAIVDDLAAIVIIATFYTADLSPLSLALATLCVLVLVGMNLAGVRRHAPYLVLGIALWLCVLKSGVHATLSGVVLAFCLPLRGGAAVGDERPFIRLAHGLRPFVLFAVMPLFAFANCGVDLAGVTWATLLNPVTLGIVAGLFIGKQLGIFAAAWALVRSGRARLPQGATWAQLYATSVCAGIGFTMSLFIGTLAFHESGYEAMVRLGVLVASSLSAIVGYMMLRATSRPQP